MLRTSCDILVGNVPEVDPEINDEVRARMDAILPAVVQQVVADDAGLLAGTAREAGLPPEKVAMRNLALHKYGPKQSFGDVAPDQACKIQRAGLKKATARPPGDGVREPVLADYYIGELHLEAATQTCVGR